LDVALSIGYGCLAPMHIRLLEVAKLCCAFIFFVQAVPKLFGLNYIHPYPQHIVAYGCSQTCH